MSDSSSDLHAEDESENEYDFDEDDVNELIQLQFALFQTSLEEKAPTKTRDNASDSVNTRAKRITINNSVISLEIGDITLSDVRRMFFLFFNDLLFESTSYSYRLIAERYIKIFLRHFLN